MSSELNDLMKVVNTKFRSQRRVFEQEKQSLQAKLDNFEKRLKEREAENATLREELLTHKKRNSELEKLMIDQNSLIHRMKSKLQVSFDNSLNGSFNKASAAQSQLDKPVFEDKAVNTDDWHTILEKELTERIERFAAYMHGNKSQESRSNGRRSINSEIGASNRSQLDRHSTNRSHFDQHTSNRSRSDQRTFNSSLASRSEAMNGENESQHTLGRSLSRIRDVGSEENLQSHHSEENHSLASLVEHPQLAAVARGTSTPATSIWQPSTPQSNRYPGSDRGDISNNDHSLLGDDTLGGVSNTDNVDVAAMEADLLQRFSDMESDANAFFDEFDEEASKHSSVVNFN